VRHGRRVVTGHRYHLPPCGLLRLGGPVVLQHLLLVALWILGGLIVGVSCVFPRELWMRLTFRNTSLAVAAYCLGRPSAANLQRRFGIRNVPFRRRFRLGGVWAKGRAAPLYAWDGRVMLTVLTSPPSDEHALEPQSAIERASFGLHSAFGAARDESAGTRIPQIVVADWGMLDQLVLLHRGKLPLVTASASFLPPRRAARIGLGTTATAGRHWKYFDLCATIDPRHSSLGSPHTRSCLKLTINNPINCWNMIARLRNR
jgi:hypothetical protein